MAKSIYEIFESKAIASYWTDVNVNMKDPMIGTKYFPVSKQTGLNLAWIKGRNNLPVALQPSAFDTKAALRDRIGVKELSTEMPFFREAMRIGEKDRQEINKAMGAANANLIEPIINNIYDDVTNLVNGAEVQAERMRMQLLSSGLIAITANRMDYDYNYKLPATHKDTLLTTAMWSATDTAKPVQDIQKWQDKIEEDTGTKPTRAICTRKTWNYLLANKSIRLDLDPIGGNNRIMTDTMLKQYLAEKLELTVAVYNKKYTTTVDGSGSLFFPDDVFTLLPDGDLGNTYYGTTPEESDLMAGNTDAQVEIVNTGVAITTVKEPHPVNVQTIVSAIELPSFERIDEIFIATVHTE